MPHDSAALLIDSETQMDALDQQGKPKAKGTS